MTDVGDTTRRCSNGPVERELDAARRALDAAPLDARGHEAVTYVGNIRTYYDMLSWLTGGPTTAKIEPPLEPPEERKLEEPLNINSPVL